jgi:trehalose-6-phosphate synthase
MQILSYRGPSAPGGVSNALTQIFNHDDEGWWFIDSDQLRCQRDEPMAFSIDERMAELHYSYCNNFLWPILHDLPQFAHYQREEHECYRSFNSAVAFRLKSAQKRGQVKEAGCFVNDYQFALVPTVLKTSLDTSVFWHIPWPKQVMPEHVDALVELASGLLNAKVIGFHTDEYLANFFDFVRNHMAHEVDTASNTIMSVSRNSHRLINRTFCLAAPLGIDVEHWQHLSRLGVLNHSLSAQAGDLFDGRFILSVDRGDYTKGILERIAGIDCFFEKYPQWREQVTFVQIGTRSRPGLSEFDKYWELCQNACADVNQKYSSNGWHPLVWFDSPKSSYELASLYNRAEVMLVTPVRDGLNLTAKEYVACAGSGGVLALSSGAGVYSELNGHCVEINATDSSDFATSIAVCLNMSDEQRLLRMQAMTAQLEANTLSSWWTRFVQACAENGSKVALQKVCS